MRRINRQAGESKAGCAIWIFIVLALVLVGAEVVPIKMNTMKLQDFMKELAMTQPRKPQHFFEKAVFDKAKELGLNVEKKNVKVRKYKERVVMDVELVETVTVLSFTYDWNISLHLDREIFLL